MRDDEKLSKSRARMVEFWLFDIFLVVFSILFLFSFFLSFIFNFFFFLNRCKRVHRKKETRKFFLEMEKNQSLMAVSATLDCETLTNWCFGMY